MTEPLGFFTNKIHQIHRTQFYHRYLSIITVADNNPLHSEFKLIVTMLMVNGLKPCSTKIDLITLTLNQS